MTAKLETATSEGKELCDKVKALCWDAGLIQQSARFKTLFRMLPPSPNDPKIAKRLGIKIVYNRIPDPITILVEEIS